MVAMAVFKSRERQELVDRWHRMMANETITARTITVDDQVAGMS